jgi:DNA polymerase-3 subunit epsilon
MRGASYVNSRPLGAISANPNVFDRLRSWAISAPARVSDRCPRFNRVEGTLSLFDWRPDGPDPGGPESAAPELTALGPTLGEGSGPHRQVGRLAKTAKASRATKSAKSAKVVELALVELALAEPAVAEPVVAELKVAELKVVELKVAELKVVELKVVERERPVASVASVGDPRIVIFDCETTGTDRLQDQVIELCVQRGLGDDAPSQTWRIKPTVAIHPGAQAVHGIAIADLEGAPSFAQVADAIAAVFAETDVIVGYNIAFDIDMLQAEYTRIGRPLLDLNGKKIVDAFRLWQQCEPRSLQHAHQRFVGAGFASAHSASADVAATGRVLSGMLRAFDLVDHDWEAIACKCDPQYASRASWVGPSRHLRWEGEVVVLGFGKHANAPVHQLAAGPDRSFLRWVVEKDFPVHVGEVCRAALERPGDEFLAWARQRYPISAVSAISAGPVRSGDA